MKQGEIWLINLDPAVGAEIRKTRPCVILNEDSIGALPLKIVAPITALKEKYREVPWMVPLDPSTTNNLDKPSVIDVFQVRALSEKRLVRRLGFITENEKALAKDALRVIFGL